jgi:SAM-dependent methyltransferase
MPNPLPESREVEAFFSRRASIYQNAVVRLLGYGWGLGVLLAHGRYLRAGARVLDAGCGTGALTRGLVRIRRAEALQGTTFHAFDLTPAMLGLLREWLAGQGVDDVELRRANVLDLGTLPADWCGYDLIVSSAMLEYLTRDELVAALRDLAARLAPGGTLLVCITRKNALMRWLVGAWWRSNTYDRAEIAAIFRAAGLSPEFRTFPFPASHLNIWGHVIEVRRRSPSHSPR